MPPLNFSPALSLLSALRVSPLRPLRTLVRTTEERFRPSHVGIHVPTERRGQEEVFRRGTAGAGLRATIHCEKGRGRVPTIVLGGFVPDASEQVFLLRRFLLQAGDVFYFSYPRDGFSLELICAQLDDLVAELTAAACAPVVIGVSFGAGIAMEWLRRARARGVEPRFGGLVLVSPVACVADVIAPGAARPATLLGRALKPYLDSPTAVPEAVVEKSRVIFTRMFEAGAQNKVALRMLMSPQEAERLRSRVMEAIRGITPGGARARVSALAAMPPLTDSFSPLLPPLATVPTLVLFAEREDAVLDERSPTCFALERAHRAYFIDSRVVRVTARAGGPPVQHASLIFHAFEFLPPLDAFYRRIRNAGLPLAA